MSRRFIAVAAATAFLGCASTSPSQPFQDTAAMVEARGGHKIVWNQAGGDDATVTRSVRDLLARELTVDAAVQVALLHNQDLVATYEDLGIAQADLVQAGLLQNPTFTGGVSLPYASRGNDVVPGFNLSVTQDFVSIFTMAARKRIARTELEAVKRRVADAVLRAAFDVSAAFYALQAAEQTAEMRRMILEAGDAALDLAHRQHDAGNINDLDVANQESLFEQVRTDLVRSDAEVASARESLARLMGVWGGDAAFRIAPKLPDLPEAEQSLEHLESLAIARRLDLAAAHEEAQATSHALAMAQNFWFFGGGSVGGSFERSPEQYSAVGASAGVDLPIFDQKQAVIARLQAQKRARLAREQALAVAIRSEVRDVRTRLVTARAVVVRYQSVVVPLRRRVVALSQQQYNAMLLGAYQLLFAKQNEVSAYRELIEALRDYWTARAALERATAGALSNASNAQGPGKTRP